MVSGQLCPVSPVPPYHPDLASLPQIFLRSVKLMTQSVYLNTICFSVTKCDFYSKGYWAVFLGQSKHGMYLFLQV